MARPAQWLRLSVTIECLLHDQDPIDSSTEEIARREACHSVRRSCPALHGGGVSQRRQRSGRTLISIPLTRSAHRRFLSIQDKMAAEFGATSFSMSTLARKR